jgi:type IX secretion system substrate protein
MRLLTVLLFVLLISSAAFSQEILYQETFADGELNNTWFTAWNGGDNMVPAQNPLTPSGDFWVGEVANYNSGGGVGTAVAGTADMADYMVEATLWTTVSQAMGPYEGIVARMDTTERSDNQLRFYMLRTDFDDSQRIQLKYYPGESGQGDVVGEWVGEEIPGGAAVESGWNTLGLKVEGNQFTCYYNGEELPGGPLTDDNQATGFFGVYIFNFMTDQAKITLDDITVTSLETSDVATGEVELPTEISIVSAYPNPFNPETTITFNVGANAQASLQAFDILGRQVATIAQGQFSGMQTVSWNANSLPAGMYFIRLESSGIQNVKQVILVK